jgi:TetR/AcrR family transcriptional regulator, lmrAB and yxaGH operons repressor
MKVVIVKGARVSDGVKQRMIREAALALARKGLQRASFAEVLEASGAPRGSLYHHFPGGKAELVLDALAAASKRVTQALDAAAGKPASEVAEAFFAIWRNVLALTDFGAGCAVAAVTVAAETPAQIDSVAAIFRAWRDQLAALLAAGGVGESQARALAATLVSAAEGAVVLARAERAFEPFDLVAAELVAAVRTAADDKKLKRGAKRG